MPLVSGGIFHNIYFSRLSNHGFKSFLYIPMILDMINAPGHLNKKIFIVVVFGRFLSFVIHD